MDLTSKVSSRELLQAHAQLWNCSVSYMKAMSLKCVIELGIPDIIHSHGQPMTLSKLISSLPNIHPSKAQCLHRLMRILVHAGFFSSQKGNKAQPHKQNQDQEEEEEQYSLSLSSSLLLKDSSLRMTEFFLTKSLPEIMNRMHHLSAWLQSDDATVYEMSDGMTLWDFLARDTRDTLIFNEAMASDSKLISKVVLDECREVFEGLKSFVDVGGGTGTMARAIADVFPEIKCTVFDLPRVVAGLQGTNNLEFVGGDMFSDPIPPADAILLKVYINF